MKFEVAKWLTHLRDASGKGLTWDGVEKNLRGEGEHAALYAKYVWDNLREVAVDAEFQP